MQTVQNAVTQVTRLTRLTGYCWQMVLPILAHLKVHYNVLGTWVHILLHLFVTAKDTFTFIYVFILIQKVKGHTCLKTLSSTWAFGWNGCFANVVHFSTLDLWPLAISRFWTLELFLHMIKWRKSSRVQTLFLNSWTFDLFEYIIFELLNSCFIELYTFK